MRGVERLWSDILDDELRGLMARRPDRPATGRRPALIAVDLYDLVYDGGALPVSELLELYPASCGEYAWNALPGTIQLFAAARAAGVPIIHVNYDTRPETDAQNVHPTNRKKRQPDPKLYTIKSELTPIEGELVIYKKRASAFFGTPLPAYLNMLDIDSLYFVGESTSGCLRASVIEGFSHGYPTRVVAEGVFDRHPLNHQVSLFDIHLKYATVIELETALAAFEGIETMRKAG